MSLVNFRSENEGLLKFLLLIDLNAVLYVEKPESNLIVYI